MSERDEDFPKPRTTRPQEVFNHDYVAVCNFALMPEHAPATLMIVLKDGRSYPLVTFALPDFGPTDPTPGLLIEKIQINGWIKRPVK